MSSWGSSNYRPSAPFLYEVASHVKKTAILAIIIIIIIINKLPSSTTSCARLAGRTSIFLTFATRSSQRSIICVGKHGGSCDACDVLGSVSGWRTSFRRTSFVVQTNILYCEISLTHNIYFWRQKLSQFVRKFVSQNQVKNVGRSGKNAGMREIHQNAGFPARLRDG